MLAVIRTLINNLKMSFAEEFRNLDPDRMRQAYANVSGKLLTISEGGEELASEVHSYFETIDEASPGFTSIYESHEDAIEMVAQTPGMEYGEEWFHMIQMSLGVVTVGLVLSEYARLEQEDS